MNMMKLIFQYVEHIPRDKLLLSILILRRFNLRFLTTKFVLLEKKLDVILTHKD